MIIYNNLGLSMLEPVEPFICSYCSKTLQLPFVYWMLSDGELKLHDSCVSEFFTKLDLEAKEIRGEI